jgi:hypothetical protein
MLISEVELESFGIRDRVVCQERFNLLLGKSEL